MHDSIRLVNSVLIRSFCFGAMMVSITLGANPYWKYQADGGYSHSIWALPYSEGGDYTPVYIGYSPQAKVPDYMLNVMANYTAKNGIFGKGNGGGTIGVFGQNDNGVGVKGWDYKGDGVVGIAGDGAGSTTGIGGRFKHLTPTGTALQVDQGNVNFYNGKTTISNATAGSDAVLSSTYSGTSLADKIAMQGVSNPGPYYGIGGWFEGGYRGVIGRSSLVGSGERIGGLFFADGGSTFNHAIEASVMSNTGNNWAGYFNGRVYSTGGYQPSDEKLKKDVTSLDSSLDKVMKLKPVQYSFNTDKYNKMGLPLEKQNGLIAQEVEAIFPEIVCETSLSAENKDTPSTPYKEPEKIKAVNYTALIPVLAKAIQEQQQTILALQKDIQNLKNMR